MMQMAEQPPVSMKHTIPVIWLEEIDHGTCVHGGYVHKEHDAEFRAEDLDFLPHGELALFSSPARMGPSHGECNQTDQGAHGKARQEPRTQESEDNVVMVGVLFSGSLYQQFSPARVPVVGRKHRGRIMPLIFAMLVHRSAAADMEIHQDGQ
eukprot:CAMPEP_0115317754 /NCGR_PEP_ID=MMETSP0270-20121206/78831_1 /TAXON_ID=71861 /ORGANISM="Scrippsiella trochoidea, Strain CCMP3099" /LENGTH=151 /DNA_ID=CAMNT_0002737261 /DNA_START=177 /DNA_END=632 /DNA_ORIENTATION=-